MERARRGLRTTWPGGRDGQHVTSRALLSPRPCRHTAVHPGTASPDFDLLGTVSRWAAGSANNRSVVASLLTALAFDATVRDKLLTWAYDYGKENTTSTHFAEVVAKVCAGEFADRYPNQALVRIKWLLNAPERSSSAFSHGGQMPGSLPLGVSWP